MTHVIEESFLMVGPCLQILHKLLFRAISTCADAMSEHPRSETSSDFSVVMMAKG